MSPLANRLIALPLALLLLPAPPAARADEPTPRTFKGTDNLVGTDLGCVKETVDNTKMGGRRHANGYYPVPHAHAVKKIDKLTLSLQPGSSWDVGKAWIIKEHVEGAERTFQAWSGTYDAIWFASDKERLCLRLFLRRTFYGSADRDGLTWRENIRFLPVSVDLETAISDDTLPERLAFSVKTARFIDDKGDPIERYSEPSTLKEKILGRGERRRARADFAYPGDTLKLRPVALDKGVAADLPPGCKPRKK